MVVMMMGWKVIPKIFQKKQKGLHQSIYTQAKISLPLTYIQASITQTA